MLENTILKIGGLLQVGFGEAGAVIIGKNMSSEDGELNILVPGRKINAVFGFAIIRDFTEITECLLEEVMVFVNKISRIVHICVHSWGGAANKNMGDAFLLVWTPKEGADGAGGAGDGMRLGSSEGAYIFGFGIKSCLVRMHASIKLFYIIAPVWGMGGGCGKAKGREQGCYYFVGCCCTGGAAAAECVCAEQVVFLEVEECAQISWTFFATCGAHVSSSGRSKERPGGGLLAAGERAEGGQQTAGMLLQAPAQEQGIIAGEAGGDLDTPRGLKDVTDDFGVFGVSDLGDKALVAFIKVATFLSVILLCRGRVNVRIPSARVFNIGSFVTIFFPPSCSCRGIRTASNKYKEREQLSSSFTVLPHNLRPPRLASSAITWCATHTR